MIPAFLLFESTTCSIWRFWHNPSHEFGASPGEYQVIAEDVICTLDRIMTATKNYSGSRDMAEQGETDIESFKLMTLSTEDILAGDRVIVDEVEYRAESVIGYSTHKEAVVKKI